MSQRGTVREYHDDEGWGVIDAAGTPGGCWVHFSAIAEPGHRRLTAGQPVGFRAEPADQDGYAYVAVKVWTGDTEPPATVPDDIRSVAYRSTLTISYDDPWPSSGGGTASA